MKERRRLWYVEQQEKPEFRDLAGWISIPDLKIESPLFSKEDDYWFYSEHNRYGEKSSEGEAGIVAGNRNIIVWDHAFIDGTRFHQLADWPDNNYSEKPLHVWLERSDGSLKKYEYVKSRYLSDPDFFQWDFPTSEQWHTYLDNVVKWSRLDLPEKLLTIYTCHTHDASVKSVLWFEEA